MLLSRLGLLKKLKRKLSERTLLGIERAVLDYADEAFLLLPLLLLGLFHVSIILLPVSTVVIVF